MIISDEYKFVFMHIPKCAGTTIKHANPGLPRVDGVLKTSVGDVVPPLSSHMPLWMLAEYFPDYFDKVRNYRSFAVIRDPFSRFCSSIRQYGREIKGLSTASLQGRNLVSLAHHVVDFLHDKPRCIDPNFSHFIPQNEYIFLNGERIIRCVELEKYDLLNEFLRGNGLNIVGSEKLNLSLVPRNGILSRAIAGFQPVFRNFLNPSFKKYLWDLMVRFGLYTEAGGGDDAIKENEKIMNFFRTYYNSDIDMVADFRSKVL